jgi:murein DD-endopeptidase MepM/ murein hydrolase activator NlpD
LSRDPRRLLHLPLMVALLIAALGSSVERPYVGSWFSLAPAEQIIDARFPEQPAELDALFALDFGPGLDDLATVLEGPQLYPAPRAFTYRVKPGDTLASIAEQFGLDLPSLLAANDLDNPDLIGVNAELTVLPRRGVLYRVANGDALAAIAERYSIALADVMQANAIDDPALIQIGDELVLPGAHPIVRRAEPAERSIAVAPRVPLSFLWPAVGPITTYFGEVGWTSPRGHAGLDIAAPWGSPVLAAAAGEVVTAQYDGGYGLEVIIDHGRGMRTVYGHLSSLEVTPGQRVTQGTEIGLIGSTGFSTGPHLHFEVRQDDELRNPLRYLP